NPSAVCQCIEKDAVRSPKPVASFQVRDKIDDMVTVAMSNGGVLCILMHGDPDRLPPVRSPFCRVLISSGIARQGGCRIAVEWRNGAGRDFASRDNAPGARTGAW